MATSPHFCSDSANSPRRLTRKLPSTVPSRSLQSATRSSPGMPPIRVSDPLRRDFNGRTAHALVTELDGSEAWLKISGISVWRPSPCREAEIEADARLGLPKPKVIAQSEWKQGEVSWRALLMAVAPSESAARDPWSAPSPSDIPESWFADLREALRAVQRVRTSRFIYTPAECTAAIKTILPEGTPTKADAWCVQHGDLHWCNLTLPHLTLLDWEVWGAGSRGLRGGTIAGIFIARAGGRPAEAGGNIRRGVRAVLGLRRRPSGDSSCEKADRGGRGVPRELEAPSKVSCHRIYKGDFGKAPRPPVPRLPQRYKGVNGGFQTTLHTDEAAGARLIVWTCADAGRSPRISLPKSQDRRTGADLRSFRRIDGKRHLHALLELHAAACR